MLRLVPSVKELWLSKKRHVQVREERQWSANRVASPALQRIAYRASAGAAGHRVSTGIRLILQATAASKHNALMAALILWLHNEMVRLVSHQGVPTATLYDAGFRDTCLKLRQGDCQIWGEI